MSGELHQHQHGAHLHEHRHVAGEWDHVHGWHSPPATCTGDDTFGDEESGPTVPLLGAPERHGDTRLGPLVVVPYIPGMLHAEVLEAIAGEAPGYLTQDVSRSQWDYWELGRRLWASAVAGRPFVLVEHDTVPPAGWYAGFDRCPYPWCVHDYRVFAGMIGPTYGSPGAFGCVRFRAELPAAHPTVFEDLERRTWSELDGRIGAALRARGFEPHAHPPPATHLHAYPDDEAARRATAELHGVKVLD